MKEDRLGAIKILCDFWHNRRKKHNEVHKEGQVALALAGKQNQTSEIIHCVGLYTSTSMDFCCSGQLPSTHVTSNIDTLIIMWHVMLQVRLAMMMVRTHPMVVPDPMVVSTMQDMSRHNL